MINDEASFSRLSPSNMVENRLGTLINLVMALTLTASGGDTMPPNKKPNANVNPGINQYAVKATPMAVMKTTIKAKLRMMRLHLNNSL